MEALIGLIEDDPDIRETVELLAPEFGHKVVAAAGSKEEAARLFARVIKDEIEPKPNTWFLDGNLSPGKLDGQDMVEVTDMMDRAGVPGVRIAFSKLSWKVVALLVVIVAIIAGLLVFRTSSQQTAYTTSSGACWQDMQVPAPENSMMGSNLYVHILKYTCGGEKWKIHADVDLPPNAPSGYLDVDMLKTAGNARLTTQATGSSYVWYHLDSKVVTGVKCESGGAIWQGSVYPWQNGSLYTNKYCY